MWKSRKKMGKAMREKRSTWDALILHIFWHPVAFSSAAAANANLTASSGKKKLRLCRFGPVAGAPDCEMTLGRGPPAPPWVCWGERLSKGMACSGPPFCKWKGCKFVWYHCVFELNRSDYCWTFPWSRRPSETLGLWRRNIVFGWCCSCCWIHPDSAIFQLIEANCCRGRAWK